MRKEKNLPRYPGDELEIEESLPQSPDDEPEKEKDLFQYPDSELEIIGHTQSTDDYKHFQWSEATMSDADSLFMREQAIAKGERPRGTNIMTYVGAILALVIGGIIAYFIFQEVVLKGGGLGGILPIGGGGGGEGEGGGGPVTQGFIPTLFAYLKLRCGG